MGSCQSTPEDMPEDVPPPSVTPKRESQPYGSADTPKSKENVAPRPPEGPLASKSKEKSSSKNKGKSSSKGKDKKSESKSDKSSSSSKSDKKPSASSTTLVIKNSTNGAGGYDSSSWKLKKQQFYGSTTFKELGKKEIVQGKSVQEGIEMFKSNPEKYVAMIYQTNMVTDRWPANQCQFVLQHRKGTTNYGPKNVSPDGNQTILMFEYERLPPFPGNILPKQYRDKWTDTMTHNGQMLHTEYRLPILPGRGMGVCDDPHLKIIGISALAEFDGAIKKLFRKTKKLDQRPFDEPNMYTVTLWDLATWKEVDYKIDERLCAAPPGSGQLQLLASKPSEDSELWVCYLEKALAIHCGGWDKITGGQCTHAWSLLTGCKEQYTIRINPETGKYACYAKFNPNIGKWAPHANSPHDCEKTMWRCPWPRVGGGGDLDKEFTADELFKKMCAWDEENYIVGAGTGGTSDKNKTDGMVDNHAYSVISTHRNVAGTKICLFKVRNPWGSGEIEDGEFDDDGPGWDKYPQVKKEINPVAADDGIFYLTKDEFFKYYSTIYLSASNMTDFLED
eukprot:scaffold1569_cov171-Amphora_coffeaeformis.AAC.2